MELIKFIFTNVFTFFGTVILLGVVLEGIASIVAAFQKKIYIDRNE